MSVMLNDHALTWTPPSPLWIDSNHEQLKSPSILRFATDDFMEELQRLLATDPEKLRGCVAVPETWRGIRKPARTANPAGGRAGVLARLGIGLRRSLTSITARPAPSSDATAMALKLYQPAHQRFYLVGSSLVCQNPGLPDRKVDAGRREKVSFVIRRWFPKASPESEDLPDFQANEWIEHAFVAQTGGGFAWVPVADSGAGESKRAIALDEEERLPLFPLAFNEDDGRARRLLAGLIPVGKRELYHAASRLGANGNSGAGGSTSQTARKVLFRKVVSEPWKALVEQARRVWTVNNTLSPFDQKLPTPNQTRAANYEARPALQLGSWFVLADLASYLQTYVPSVYQALKDKKPPASDKAKYLFKVLNDTLIGEDLKKAPGLKQADLIPNSMAAALHMFILEPSIQASLELTSTPYTWPKLPEPLGDPDDPVTANPEYPQFLFPLADPEFILQAASPAITAPLPTTEETAEFSEPIPPEQSPPPTHPDADFDTYKADIDTFAAVVIRALEDADDQPEPVVPTAAERPADMRDGWFHIRCVYERPACGALHQDVVSAPSELFQLAGFFDPDAPARPIRIGLPIDTTPAGLRKFDKNTAFMMSDILCGQISRLKGMTLGDLVLSVLPWPFHKDLPAPEKGPCGAGLVCSLSIPIITICALLLLVIMVTVLDSIFHWLPWFWVCFPIGIRGKKVIKL